MCEELVGIRASVVCFAAGVDPDLLTAGDAILLLREIAMIEGATGALKALAAGRAAEGDALQLHGERSDAEGLAAETGIGIGTARDLLLTGRRLRHLDRLAQVAKSGTLSPQKLALLVDAAETVPEAGGQLLDEAPSLTFAELRDACMRAKAAATDLEARRRRIHARRSLRAWTDAEGVWHLSGRGNLDEGADVMAALAPHIEDAFRRARLAGLREPYDAYAFDGLVAMARGAASSSTGGGAETSEREADEPAEASAGGSGDESVDGNRPAQAHATAPGRPRGGPPAKVLVRIDYDTFLRGVPLEGETCEFVGYGPVPVSMVDDLVERGDAFVAAIMTKGRDVAGVAHLGRRPNAYQESALQWLFPTCAVSGCSARARLEADHRVDWAKTHYTMLDLLDMLCRHHHALKTRQNWALVEGKGKRDFVPPTDPRHPANHARGPRAPAARMEPAA